MSDLMYDYPDPIFGSLPPAKKLVNITARSLADQQEFARQFGTSMKSLDRTMHDGFAGVHKDLAGVREDLSRGFDGVNSHLDAVGQQISGQIASSTDYLADTVVNVGQGIQDTTVKVGQALSDQMVQSTAHLQGTMEHGFNYLGDTTVKVGQALGRQMFDNTQHLSTVFQDIGAQLGHTIFQSTAAITGSIFIASLNTNRVLSRAIQRQTRELKNELLEIRAEQMHTRRAIVAAQLLTYHEIAELKVQTLRNHTETIWMLMRQSSILQDILGTLKHPLRTKALELAETGHYLMSRGLFEQALQALTEAKETIHDREPSIAVSLAFVHDHLRQGRKVEERLQHAASLAEDRTFTAYVHGLLSDFYWQAGDKEKSFASSATALSHDPFSPVVRINHAAILAESSRISEARALLDGLLRDDTDHAKAILDRQTFYHHDLIADVLQFTQQHLDPATEALKDQNADLQEKLRLIREHGHYRQFTGHKKRFEETFHTLTALKTQRERTPATLKWHQDINTTYRRLTEIEEDAARATAATQRFTRLTAAREEVSQFLDAVLSRARAITLDAARHPMLHMEMEKIKAHLAEIASPDVLHAACDFTINFLSIHIHTAESAYAEASQSNILFRGKKRSAAANSIATAIAKLRDDIEKLRFEKITGPFQICPACSTRWPREYKRCGQCGSAMQKPLKLEQSFTPKK